MCDGIAKSAEHLCARQHLWFSEVQGTLLEVEIHLPNLLRVALKFTLHKERSTNKDVIQPGERKTSRMVSAKFRGILLALKMNDSYAFSWPPPTWCPPNAAGFQQQSQTACTASRGTTGSPPWHMKYTTLGQCPREPGKRTVCLASFL